MTVSTLPRIKRPAKVRGTRPPRVVIYCRISRDRIGKGLGVDRQEAETREVIAADMPDAEVVAVLSDNDKSGYSGKPRDGYETLVGMIERGEVDVLAAWHMDRLTRRVTELAGLIELCQRHGVIIRTKLAGAFDPNNPSAVMAAQIQGTVAEYESAVKSERAKSKHRQLATDGHRAGGGRWFGFRFYVDPVTETETKELVHDDGEAAIVREVAGRILHGESMASLARDLNDRGVTTVKGLKWTGQSLRSVMVGAHLAGLRTHRGEVVAVAKWPAILDVPTWEAVNRRLHDPARCDNQSPASKWLLTNIARCGVCGGPMRVQGGAKRAKTYICDRAGHVARSAEKVEATVTEWVVERLSQLDARGVLADDTDAVDLANLTMRLSELDELENTLADRWASGELSQARYDRDLAAVDKRRAVLDAAIGTAADKVAAPIRALDGLTGPDPREVFAELPLARRRAVIDVLATVHVDKSSTGRRFDPSSIRVVPKTA